MTPKNFEEIGIGGNNPCFIIAEVSANHNHDLDRALAIIEAASNAGADAIKLQTYTADTLTIKSDRPEFQVSGTIWEGETLYSLFEKASLPWDWHQPLFNKARELGLQFLSTPFDFSAVDFLESLEVDFYKIASSELIDIPLIKRVAQTGKPVLISTGMGNLSEIEEAIETLNKNGCPEICLLKCTAAYPAKIEEANLNTLVEFSDRFGAIPGLSDHTMGPTLPMVATALGAKVIEKHITLKRGDGGPDSAFSLEPDEFKDMVDVVRSTEAALGRVMFEPSAGEIRSRDFRRSLYVVADIKMGEKFTPENVRSIRPANGVHPRFYEQVLGKNSLDDIKAGTPLQMVHFDG